MITEVMIERALAVYSESIKSKTANMNKSDAMRAALEAVEGAIEQRHDNEQVRRLRTTGICPVCGGEPASNPMD